MAVAEKDRPEFKKVYDENKDNVWKLVSRYVSSQEDREDLFQEVFVKVHGALKHFRGEAGINTWLYKITVNTALNFLKRQKRHKMLTDVLMHMRITEADEERKEADAFRPLKELNPQQKMILILSDVEEKKLEEIAGIMRLPIGTVKSNLFRARETIKKELMENGRL